MITLNIVKLVRIRLYFRPPNIYYFNLSFSPERVSHKAIEECLTFPSLIAC